MDFPLQSPSSFLLLFSLLILTAFLLRLRRKPPYPPGPRGLPIIGNLLMMNQLTHRGLANLAAKYGGLFHLRLGKLHMVVVSTPEIAREVLQVQDIVFSNRPANLAIGYLTYDRSDMAFANYGAFWRQMRKICVMKLFSRRREESWASVREEVAAVVREVSTRIGEEVNIGDLVFGLTRNITYKAAFGSRSHQGQEEFVEILQEFSKLFGAFNIADFLPWLGWIHAREFNGRMEKARKSLDVFIDRIIDEHVKKKMEREREGLEAEGDSDMVDELLAFLADESSSNEFDDSDSALKLTRDNIKALIMDVMFGGTETVASVIEWAIAELLKSPADLQNLQTELTHVVGLHRTVHDSDLPKLPLLHHSLKETLRLHPPIPLLLHESAAPTALAGRLVPAGARVWVNAWAIARDPRAWPDPALFRPARFRAPAAPDFRGAHFEFLPFGSGRRSCPGMQLGLYACEMAVAQLLHCFAWELPKGMAPSQLDMSDAFGLTAPRAVRLVAVPNLRVDSAVFEAEAKGREDW